MSSPALLIASVLAARASTPLSADLSGALNADLVAGDPSPDAACMRDAGHPSRPARLVMPARGAADAVVVSWTPAQALPRAGLAATVTLVFEDGQSVLHRAFYGKQLADTAITGRLASARRDGTRADGSPLVVTEWFLPTGRPSTALSEVRVDLRGPVAPCLLSVHGRSAEIELVGVDTSSWYPYAMDTAIAPVPRAGAVEAPAGDHGFLTLREDGHLWFEDGTRARFWGINLVGEPAIPDKADADAYAATLAAIGFNMVRIHHVDGPPPRGVLNPSRTADPATWLDAEQQDRLDFFLSRLKAHGLYLFLEVATERTFTAVDGVSGSAAIPNGHKQAPMWRDDWNAAYLRWFEAFWGRVNPYTSMRYADDPFVAMVELSNEHSILMMWGMGLENLPPEHLAALDARWNVWLRTRYADDTALAAAWGGASYPGLRPGESLETGTIAREPRHAALFDRWPARRARDLYEFYAGLELGWYQGVERKARELGFRVPFVPSIHYDQPILQLLQAPWGIADEHFVYDPLRGRAWTDASALARPESILATTLSAVDGRATAVTELNHPWPNHHRAEGPLVWATYASIQDWDVLLWFNWSDTPWPGKPSAIPGSFDLRSTPVTLAQLPTASAIFRNATLPPASGEWWHNVPPGTVVEQYLTPETHRRHAGLRPLEAMDLAFVLSHRIRSSFLESPRAYRAGAPPAGVGWWADPGVLVLDLPTVQARVGPPEAPRGQGAGTTRPTGLEVDLAGWAAVSLASTDGLPLGRSSSALLAVSTRQENTGTRYAVQGTEVLVDGYAPVRVEPAVGAVRFRWPTRPEVRVLGPDGRPGEHVRIRRAGRGWWSLETTALTSPWFLVSTPA